MIYYRKALFGRGPKLTAVQSQVQVLVGPPAKQAPTSDGGGFCLLSVTLSKV
jgi:hypothetical protein